MKLKYLVYLLLSLFFVAQPIRTGFCSYTETETFTTGKDWIQKMSKGEKFISVYAPMILLHRYGINFRKTPNEYAQTLDRVLLENPYLEKEEAANIFASTVYAYEPESRPAFKIMQMEFEQENLKPTLLIHPRSQSEVKDSVEK
ncbi:MAG: hypothetical protein COT00_05390 [Candidatus Omnitrophica bacterium CG07_land_8_20_14_0_80_50_8]|nr:MAG: hypothetical protein AUJ71_02315 [Candidatus Omnitrophica bacterium CG1_02_49_16]PIU39731.1 MAG: hypothetical protein COT00_05390 [Candidatus Omnitrophica bacterium CG07_land_8_20_14_0_80_50_8]